MPNIAIGSSGNFIFKAQRHPVRQPQKMDRYSSSEFTRRNDLLRIINKPTSLDGSGVDIIAKRGNNGSPVISFSRKLVDATPQYVNVESRIEGIVTNMLTQLGLHWAHDVSISYEITAIGKEEGIWKQVKYTAKIAGELTNLTKGIGDIETFNLMNKAFEIAVKF